MTLDKVLARATLNSFKTNKTADRPLFISGFNQESDRIKQATTGNINILRADGTLTTSIKNPALLVHKLNRSLCDILVQADHRYKYVKPKVRISQKSGCYRCYNCNVCNSIICGEHFIHPHNGRQYHIQGYTNCNTEFCVYILKCPCSLMYVGKTVGLFKQRFQKHRSDIRVAL